MNVQECAPSFGLGKLRRIADNRTETSMERRNLSSIVAMQFGK